MTEPVVYTTFDKEKRNELWRELRTRGRGSERQAVRFSGVEQVGEILTPVLRRRWIKLDDGKYALVPFESVESRPVYRSTWSVSHPAEIETLKGKANGRTEASLEA